LSLNEDTIGQAAGKDDVDRDEDYNANYNDDQGATTKDNTQKAAGSNEAPKPEKQKDGATAKETETTIAQTAKPNTESKDDDSNAKSDAATADTAKADTKKAAANKESAKPDSKKEGTAANITKIPCTAGAKCECGGFIVTDPGKMSTKHICRELTELTEMERSIVADIRIYCQSWAFFAGAHQHIKGWHTFYSNPPEHAVANLEQLKLGGLKGQIMMVLCGRFTTTQRALTMKKTLVNAERVIRAFEWLKKNNFVYKDIVIPDLEDIPLPVVIDETM
jgi:hypothetical protein